MKQIIFQLHNVKSGKLVTVNGRPFNYVSNVFDMFKIIAKVNKVM